MDNIQKSLLKNKNWHEIVINKNFSSQSKKMDINNTIKNDIALINILFILF